ncbi:MAG: glycosyltransferase family 4 protein [Candidatus Omnitrophica bacterium]|nr:glycosyltransferase family 4 protein [Candidatus Omnitrophota bacterium]
MKIIRVLPSMDFGGIERGVYDFSKKVIQLGHKIIIISSYGKFLPELMEKGIKWYQVNLDKKNLKTFINGYIKLKKIIKEEKPDIIHFQSRFPCWIGYFVMKKFPEIPYITSIHSFSPFPLYTKSTGKGDLVIVVSKALKEYAIKKLKVPENKIRVIYNGIDIDEFFIDREFEKKDIWKIGMIGRFSILKGHYYFIESINILIKRKNENIKGIIYGSGSKSLKKIIEKWIEEKNLEGFIEIVVGKNSKEIMKEIDILVVPSIEPEGFGRVIVEGMVSGIPSIATNIGAVPEIIENGKTGFLVEPKNSLQIAECIEKLIKNHYLYIEISKNSQKESIKRFNLDKMVNETLKVYEESIFLKKRK